MTENNDKTVVDDTPRVRLPVAASPHLRNKQSDASIMWDVVLALLPAIAGSIYIFGTRVIPYYLVAVAMSMLCDWLWQRAREEPYRFDYSPLVTGLLLAMSLPGTAPLWFAAAGAVLAIIVAKECFGGIGKNLFNPAIFGRGVLRIVFVAQMTRNIWPRAEVPYQVTADVVTGATPLELIKNGMDLDGGQLLATFLGTTGGKIGETSALLLLLGAAYLLCRRVIRFRILVAMLGTIAIVAFLFGGRGFAGGSWGVVAGHLLGGASILGAFYMATDYSTSPSGPLAQWIYGAGCGLVTMLFRFYSDYPEGFTFALLVMNLTVPLFDRFMLPRVIGTKVEADTEKEKTAR
ncbi:MAG: RnfABCDGE type electron transport complex subunit D [Planctomycetaceae bacterium]|nr:RnfABCDGE type electron transport complex subunit D [Planctomycetaceae bacterium]